MSINNLKITGGPKYQKLTMATSNISGLELGWWWTGKYTTSTSEGGVTSSGPPHTARKTTDDSCAGDNKKVEGLLALLFLFYSPFVRTRMTTNWFLAVEWFILVATEAKPVIIVQMTHSTKLPGLWWKKWIVSLSCWVVSWWCLFWLTYLLLLWI